MVWGKNFAKMEQKLETVLSELATKLGTSVDKLYELTQKQAKIELIGKIVNGIIWVIFIPVLILIDSFLSQHTLTEKTQYSTDITFYGIGFGICSILIIAFCVLIIVEMSDYFKELYTLLYNPEYWAFQQIMSSIK